MESTNSNSTTQPEIATLEIFSSEPEVKAGNVTISFRRKKVSEANSFRAVQVQAYSLPSAVYQKQEGEETTIADAEEVFAAAISEVFLSAASSILRRYCDEKPEAKTIPADFLNFTAVTTEMAQQQTSQRLNGDAIAAWYDASETSKEAASRYGSEEKGKKQQAALREKFLSLASNNPAIPVPLATKMLAYISPKDTEHNICRAVCKRLEKLTSTTTDADEL